MTLNNMVMMALMIVMLSKMVSWCPGDPALVIADDAVVEDEQLCCCSKPVSKEFALK